LHGNPRALAAARPTLAGYAYVRLRLRILEVVETMSKKINRRKFLASSPVLGVGAVGLSLGTTLSPGEEPESLLTVRREPDEQEWLMPASFGSPSWPQPWPDPPGEAHYNDVTTIAIRYLTDGPKLRPYLPYPYELDDPPIVKVAYSMNRGITWLAGGSYNVVGVTVRATYRGEKDQVSGDYALVLWENLTAPILTGREIQGIPKIYGDIEDHRTFNGVMSTSLKSREKIMLEIDAVNLIEIEAAEFEQLNSQGADGRLLGWKYIPDETASGPVVSYATEFPISSRYSQAWSATGHLKWHHQEWAENPTQSHIVNAMCSLPVKRIVSCTVTRGSKILHAGRVRRLR
jgi:acetoacetate decarboxylase